MPIYHAFIRTHHITSRKKVAILKAAAKKFNVSALLRSGGVPGLMYVRGQTIESVQDWVDTVHDLRYKDYQLVAAPEELIQGKGRDSVSIAGGLEEVAAVRNMGSVMDRNGCLEWWKRAMGYIDD